MCCDSDRNSYLNEKASLVMGRDKDRTHCDVIFGAQEALDIRFQERVGATSNLYPSACGEVETHHEFRDVPLVEGVSKMGTSRLPQSLCRSTPRYAGAKKPKRGEGPNKKRMTARSNIPSHSRGQ